MINNFLLMVFEKFPRARRGLAGDAADVPAVRGHISVVRAPGDGTGDIPGKTADLAGIR